MHNISHQKNTYKDNGNNFSFFRLFSNLPKFVCGCDHVVKFFQSDKRTRKKPDSKKAKGSTKKDEQSDKVNQREFETPHKIAEAVREQSLGGKDNMKSLDVAIAKKQSQNNVPDEEEPVTGLDENGNEVKVLLPGKLSGPFV